MPKMRNAFLKKREKEKKENKKRKKIKRVETFYFIN